MDDRCVTCPAKDDCHAMTVICSRCGKAQKICFMHDISIGTDLCDECYDIWCIDVDD